MSRSTLIIILVALVVITIVAYFLFFRKSTKTATSQTQTEPEKKISVHTGPKENPVTNATGEGGIQNNIPPPPSNVPPKKNDIAVAIRRTEMFASPGKTTSYTAGGSDGTGHINSGYTAGKVLDINTVFNTAKVQNYSTPGVVVNWIGSNDEYNTFWVSLNDLKKQ